MTQERATEFIEEYTRKEIIWDPKSVQCISMKQKKKHEAWEELANEINRTVDQCKTTMEELLSSVGRDKMK